MILHSHGLAWDVPSPSFYRLMLPRPDIAAVDITYLGTPAGLSSEASCEGGWLLFLERNGNVTTRCFPNRDHALGMVAEAFKF